MKNYFDDDEEVEPVEIKVRISQTDYSGLKFAAWTVLSRYDNRYLYHVRCKCGKEFIRNIQALVKGRSSKCTICSRKNNMRWIPARLRD